MLRSLILICQVLEEQVYLDIIFRFEFHFQNYGFQVETLTYRENTLYTWKSKFHPCLKNPDSEKVA